MIETSSLPENDQENTMFGMSSRVMTLGNEENQENMINSNETSFSTPKKKDAVLETPTTVSARREWLKNFAKRNSNHYTSRNNKTSSEPLCKPQVEETRVHEAPRSTTATKFTRLVVPVADSMLSMEPALLSEKRKFTPRKKKILHAGIEATDDGVASVAKLSQWLASDPTAAKKKKMSVRRGRNVSYKSRKFDRGQENVVVKENHIQRGSVSDKKNWLKNAFQNMEEEPVDELTSRLNTQYAKSEVGVYDPSIKRYAQSEIVTSRPSTMTVSAKKDWLKKAFKSAAEAASSDDEQQGEARSMIITDDVASRLSVLDRKSWLQGAFKKSEEIHSHSTRPTASSHIRSSAATDIVHSRSDSQDEIAARAKRRFLQRSTRTGSEAKSPVEQTPTKRRADSEQESNAETDTTDNVVSKEQLEESSSEPMRNGGSIVEPIKQPTRQVVVEEDRTPVDFRAAREFLVQTARKNCETTDCPVNRAHF
ncbi:MAG: hypothetical protein SGBAC_001578 [Bacillariaceae sp.]